MRKATLYIIEAVFLLAFWAYMFLYVKPGFAVVAILLVGFAFMFTVLEKVLTEKKAR